MTRKFFDSHKKFKAFTVEQLENETRRQFERRTWEIYSKLVDIYETPADGERVYMKDIKVDGGVKHEIHKI